MKLVTAFSFLPSQPKAASYPDLSREVESRFLSAIERGREKHKVIEIPLKEKEIHIKNCEMLEYHVKDNKLIGLGRLEDGRRVIAMLASVEYCQ